MGLSCGFRGNGDSVKVPVALTCNEGSGGLETLIADLFGSAVGLGRLMLMELVDACELKGGFTRSLLVWMGCNA